MASRGTIAVPSPYLEDRCPYLNMNLMKNDLANVAEIIAQDIVTEIIIVRLVSTFLLHFLTINDYSHHHLDNSHFNILRHDYYHTHDGISRWATQN
jgi:hypothetical protein